VTRRIAKLVLFEWQKLLARRFALIALVLVALIAFLSPYAGGVVDEAQSLSSGAGAGGGTDAFERNGWVSLATGVSWGLEIVTYIVLLFGASAISEESQLGTLKTLFTRPVKRAELLFSKWFALSSYAVALLLACTLAAGLAGALRFGFTDVVDPAYPEKVFTHSRDMVEFGLDAFALSLPSLVALVALGLLFSCAIDHPGYSVGAAISTYFVLKVTTKLSARAARFLFARYTLLAAEYFSDIARAYPEKRHFAEEVPRLLAVPLVSALVFFAGAAWLLYVREVGD
jgi:ABC-type transport system involved in multi-copper enzyme maturation permease subunit